MEPGWGGRALLEICEQLVLGFVLLTLHDSNRFLKSSSKTYRSAMVKVSELYISIVNPSPLSNKIRVLTLLA